MAFINLQKKINEKQTQDSNQYFDKTIKLFKSFQESLELFASENLHKIEKDGELRQQFSQLCADLGIDPLSSSSSIFSKMLGDYYYRLATKLMDYCERRQGLVDLNQYIQQFNQKLNAKNQISRDDIIKTIAIINQLSPGYSIINKQGVEYIQCIDDSENKFEQQLKKMLLDGQRNTFSKKDVQDSFKLTIEKADEQIDRLINEARVAVDNQAQGGWKDPIYWYMPLV